MKLYNIYFETPLETDDPRADIQHFRKIQLPDDIDVEQWVLHYLDNYKSASNVQIDTSE